MKWKNEIPNKTEFMKINSFNFIENEKFNSEIVHEKNVGKIRMGTTSTSEAKEVKDIKSYDNQTSVPKIADNQNSERRTMTETITFSKSRTDFSGSAPKRYTTKCFIKPVVVPYWYSESLTLNIGSTKRRYTEKVHFKDVWRPSHWSENMLTEVKTGPKCILSEFEIPVDDDEFHYISLEPQQAAKTTTEL